MTKNSEKLQCCRGCGRDTAREYCIKCIGFGQSNINENVGRKNLPFVAVDSDRVMYDTIPVNVDGSERPWLKKPGV